MISIAIASLFFVLCVWFLYMAIQVFKSLKLDKETELKELKLNIKKSDVIVSLGGGGKNARIEESLILYKNV